MSTKQLGLERCSSQSFIMAPTPNIPGTASTLHQEPLRCARTVPWGPHAAVQPRPGLHHLPLSRIWGLGLGAPRPAEKGEEGAPSLVRIGRQDSGLRPPSLILTLDTAFPTQTFLDVRMDPVAPICPRWGGGGRLEGHKR